MNEMTSNLETGGARRSLRQGAEPPRQTVPSPEAVRKQLAKELVGEKVKVADSSCKDLLGIEGTIIDESLNTFTVSTAKGLKRIPKKNTTFLFEGLGVTASGNGLQCRPEDRTKKVLKG